MSSSRRSVSTVLCLLPVLLLYTGATTCLAAPYVQVLTMNQVNGGETNFNKHLCTVVDIDGTTTYHEANYVGSPSNDFRITKTVNTGTSPSTSKLTDLATWTLDLGYPPSTNKLAPGLGAAVVGDYIQMAEVQSRAVVRVNKFTGQASAYVSTDQIKAHTGKTSAGVTEFSGVSPGGETIFYESASLSILQTNGAGLLTTVVTTDELAAAQLGGNTNIQSGLTYDDAGNLYWGHGNGDRIYKRAPDGSITYIAEEADFLALLGNTTSANFQGDMYFGPDGLIYFRYGREDPANSNITMGIYSIDPAAADPGATLGIVLSNAQLKAGPAASPFTYHMSWFNDNLAFTCQSEKGVQGYYNLPEPGSLTLLLGIGSLVVLRRRR